MKKFVSEFKEFISRGNVLDMAVGVVIGGAFTAIVTALVDNIITPLIGVLVGGLDFTGLSVKVGEATIGYGAFIQAVINFLLISFVIFCVIRSFNKLAKKKEEEPAAPPAPAEDVVLLREIRDLLANQEKNSER
ncbi:MAG: large-conductance mechanosensitive channel protein MscL [Mogibacterium sp.]|uniref:large-conductance mechanosensitive channel protein MscL n=1 Tax=Mogibacterium sp. TaxID=2049035 RepID=UPI001A3C11A5|nr:large-conductance mechanosensitive channel protein MscL [Mogibacterium sp.]MBL6468271.1 large-conductance mechanosensitive channel protein MscL [Mogibacterium sp.]